MELSPARFREITAQMGLWGFPRFCGNPRQKLVHNEGEFWEWFEENNGKKPLFWSHSRLQPGKNASEPSRDHLILKAGCCDMDVDKGAKPETVFEEVCRAAQFLRDEGVPFSVDYSGSHFAGFHIFPIFQEARLHAQYLNRWENAFWRGLQAHLHLTSLDPKSAEPQRVIRVPFGRYVHRSGDKNDKNEGWVVEDNFTVPLDLRLLLDGGTLQECWSYSAYPEDTGNYVYPGHAPKLEDFVKDHGWTSLIHGPEREGSVNPGLGEAPVGPTADLVKLYAPEYPCIQELLFGGNPTQHLRFAACTAMVHLDPPLNLAVLKGLWDRIAEEARWADGWNKKERDYQIEHIYNRRWVRRDAYKVPSCRTLKKNGLCLGERCHRFAEEFPELVQKKAAPLLQVR